METDCALPPATKLRLSTLASSEKSGADVTVTVTEMLWLSEPEIAVNVNVEDPATAFDEAVRLTFCDPPAVSEKLAGDALTPDGSPLSATWIVPVNPLIADADTETGCALPPGESVRLAVLEEREKSAGGGVECTETLLHPAAPASTSALIQRSADFHSDRMGEPSFTSAILEFTQGKKSSLRELLLGHLKKELNSPHAIPRVAKTSARSAMTWSGASGLDRFPGFDCVSSINLRSRLSKSWTQPDRLLVTSSGKSPNSASVASGCHCRILLTDRRGVDREARAQLVEVPFPLRPLCQAQRANGKRAGAQNLIPDVLRLPQVQLKRHLHQRLGHTQRALQNLERSRRHLQL